jgi:S-formylglutathione hydrolase FrmB
MPKLRSVGLARLSAASAALLLAGLPCLPVLAQAPAAQPAVAHPVHFRVQAPANLTAPLNGRLLLFLKAGHGDTVVDNDPSNRTTWVGAREVHDLAAGTTIEIDPDAEDIAFPTPFASIPTGNYEVQAVLDVDHSYNYGGRDPQDWVSPVVELAHWAPGTGAEPTLRLTEHAPGNADRAAALAKAKAEAAANGAQLERIESPLLSGFWGRPIDVQAWVIVPPGYAEHGQERYPTVYWTHGFGGTIDSAVVTGMRIYDRMKAGKMPPMIWVMLDESCPQGTHEFADSANDGPWGAALTTEFLPSLEKKYRMDARVNGRFLNGHSSGGWATLQLEVNYPKIFGGTWSTSPDPSDFHDFTGPDLYAPHANMYRKADGSAWPLVRIDGKVVATVEQFAQLERVLGPYGGQLASFDWVFSPKGPSGAPVPMFDRVTGDVDPAVVAYWHDHYDLAHIVEAHWPELRPDLTGRIHLTVGTADTFYLDGAAHKFEAVLDRLGAEPHFTYLPGRSHMNVYVVGQDQYALFDQISAEMYAIARPEAHWQAAAATK